MDQSDTVFLLMSTTKRVKSPSVSGFKIMKKISVYSLINALMNTISLVTIAIQGLWGKNKTCEYVPYETVPYETSMGEKRFVVDTTTTMQSFLKSFFNYIRAKQITRVSFM